MHPLSSLPYLRAFDAVAQHGSVRRASEELGLTPGAVSLQLRRLGEITGLDLFEKSGRGIRLTPAGESFSHAVRSGLSDIALGLHDAQALGADQPDKPLRVSIPPALGIAWLAGAIVEYARQAGRTRVHVLSGTGLSGIDWDAVDLAVVWDTPPFPGCWWKLLTDVESQPVCAPRLLARLGSDNPVRNLKDVTILHEDDGKTWANWAAKTNVAIDDAAHVYFPSPALAQAAAVQGQGVALISSLLAATDIQEGRLVRLFRTSISRSRGYYFVCPAERAELPLITSAIASLSAVAG